MDAMAGRLLEVLEMWEDGVQIMRENLRRRLPRATDEEIESELARWLAGPDGVDANYLLVDWPGVRDDQPRPHAVRALEDFST